jgi:hypothetical protein
MAGIARSRDQGNRNIVGAENVFPFRSGYNDEIRGWSRDRKSTGKRRIAIVARTRRSARRRRNSPRRY